MTEDAYRRRLEAARSRRREQVYRSLRKEEGEGDESGDLSSSSDDSPKPPPPPVQGGGGENKVLWAILVLILLASVGGGAYYLFFRSPSSSTTSFDSSDSAAGGGAETVTATKHLSSAADSSSADVPASTGAKSSPSSSAASEHSSSTAASSADSSDPSPPGEATSSPEGYNLSSLKDQGITAFLGNNSGGIASWYRTNSGQDSTNGRSWCEFPYDDTVPGFAPSVGTMRENFGGDDAAAKKAFCGLWAVVYSPKTGKEVKLIIADGFDDAWIRDQEKHSIDVIKGSFAELFGEGTDDKNDVVMDSWWMLTGERDEKFTYKGIGVG